MDYLKYERIVTDPLYGFEKKQREFRFHIYQMVMFLAKLVKPCRRDLAKVITIRLRSSVSIVLDALV